MLACLGRFMKLCTLAGFSPERLRRTLSRQVHIETQLRLSRKDNSKKLCNWAKSLCVKRSLLILSVKISKLLDYFCGTHHNYWSWDYVTRLHTAVCDGSCAELYVCMLCAFSCSQRRQKASRWRRVYSPHPSTSKARSEWERVESVANLWLVNTQYPNTTRECSLSASATCDRRSLLTNPTAATSLYECQ